MDVITRYLGLFSFLHSPLKKLDFIRFIKGRNAGIFLIISHMRNLLSHF